MHNMPHSKESREKMSKTHKGKPNYGRRRKQIIKDGITLYQCSTCREFYPYEGFYRDKRTILGITCECKKCHCKTSVNSRNVDNARQKNKEYARRKRKLNIGECRKYERERPKRPKDEKYMARYKLNYAVRHGRIIKPSICEKCGKDKKLTAHHKDYSKPLEVIWLCYECHGMIHRKK